jgi:hypothetical protein
MTEAFEIGVSLALQDGVSDAIGKARRDVAALEHAVRESGISLRSLRDVGARSASVAFGERRREVASRSAVEEPPLEGSAPRSNAAAVMQKGVPPRVEDGASLPIEGAAASWVEVVTKPAAPADSGASPAHGAFGKAVLVKAVPSQDVAPVPRAKSAADLGAPMPRLEASPHAPVALALMERLEQRQAFAERFVSAPIVASPLAPLEDSRQVAAPVAVATLADRGGDDAAVGGHEMAPATASRLVRGEASQVQPAVQLAGRADALAMWGAEGTQDAPPPAEQPALKAGHENGFARPMSLLSALRLSGGSPVGTQGDDHSTAVDDDASADTSLPESASASPAAMPSRRPATGGDAPGEKARDTEQAGARDAGPQEGDVFLDGMLVGRWMSRFLNREMSRASAGPTGFDARRGQLLPGVTVGG